MTKFWFSILVIFFIFSSMPVSGKGLAKSEIAQDTILTPWKPIRVMAEDSRLIISCWDREYIFDHSFLPSQIISNGMPLLSRPIQVLLTVNSRTVQWQQPTVKVKKKNNIAIELEGKAVSSTVYGMLVINSLIHIEYDGLMLISLSVQSSDRIDSFSIHIPYKDENTKYYLKWTPNRHEKYSGRFPEKTGLLLEGRYTPYFWIGDNSKGLFWFCQTENDWPNSNHKNAIQFIKIDSEVIQQFNLGATKKFSFGLQATPVKPFPANWRKWRLSPASNSNIVILWGYPGKAFSVKYHSWPEAVDKEVFRKRVEKYHAQGKKVIAYAAIFRMSASTPVFQRNRSHWIKGPVKMNVKGDQLVYIEPGSEGYIDTIVNAFSHYMKAYDLDGYYLDGGDLYKYWKDAAGNPNYPILKYRELQKKLYAAVKKINPEAILITHASAQMCVPVLAYTDAYVDGEQFRYSHKGKLAYKVQDSYMDDMTLDQFRAEFMGKQWGVIPFFLPEISPNYREKVQPTLGLASLLLVHDVQPWATNSNLTIWNEMYQALDKFGLTLSEFIPYYDSLPPATTNLDKVFISAYRKKNGVLVIAANLSKEEQNGIITLNLNRLGIKKIDSIVPLLYKDRVVREGNRLSVSIPSLSYKMFWIKQ